MATQEQRKEALETVTSELSGLAKVDPTTLARTSDLSPTINFKQAVPHFQVMLDLCKQLSQRDLSRLTHQQLSAISGACKRLEQLIAQVRDFTLNQNTPGDVCTSIINQISGAYDDVMNPLLLPLSFTATQATDYSRIEREAKGYYETMKAQSEELNGFMEQSRSEAAQALEAVKEQAAQAGVSKNAQIFLQDAGIHKDAAKKWLVATIITVSLTFCAAVAIFVLAFFYHPADLSATLEYVIAKLLVLSALFYAAVWCSRNYRAQKHNETLNRHRANALMTFRAFVEGTADERVKDAILLHAAQAAFAGRPTGYDSAESEPSTTNPVIDVLGKVIPHSTHSS